MQCTRTRTHQLVGSKEHLQLLRLRATRRFVLFYLSLQLLQLLGMRGRVRQDVLRDAQCTRADRSRTGGGSGSGSGW
jgi:hypothetical protein